MTTDTYNTQPDIRVPQIIINRMGSLLPLPFLLVCGLQMMAKYNVLYWNHFHPQVPILYKHSLKLATWPHLLQLAISIIGAFCCPKSSMPEITQACYLFIEFLAKDLKRKLDKIPEQATDLWVASALLHLEIFEKRYSIYAFQERSTTCLALNQVIEIVTKVIDTIPTPKSNDLDE